MYSDKEKTVQIDCSGHSASNDNLAKLNEYFQKKQLPALQIESSKSGPDHQPTFTCWTNFEKKTYTATSQTKKEAEKKVKSYIYEYCINIPTVRPSGGVVYNPTPVVKRSSTVQVAEYENFKKILSNVDLERDTSLPVLVIDLLSIDIGTLRNKEIEKICQEAFSRIIVYSYHEILEWENTIVLTNKETDAPLIHESINRILYFLLDHNQEKEIYVLTKNKYPLASQLAKKTGQNILSLKDASLLNQFA